VQRDIRQLIDLCPLVRNPGGSNNTNYRIADHIGDSQRGCWFRTK